MEKAAKNISLMQDKSDEAELDMDDNENDVEQDQEQEPPEWSKSTSKK